MPTIEVLPDAEQLLQQIADALLKSRKVVVITGAGISTNSGIPDFRSENGLYSLIQAQFDAANKLHALAAAEADDTPAVDERSQPPPPKRRRLSQDTEPTLPSVVVATSPPRDAASTITEPQYPQYEAPSARDSALGPEGTPLGDLQAIGDWPSQAIATTANPVNSLESHVLAQPIPDSRLSRPTVLSSPLRQALHASTYATCPGQELAAVPEHASDPIHVLPQDETNSGPIPCSACTERASGESRRSRAASMPPISLRPANTKMCHAPLRRARSASPPRRDCHCRASSTRLPFQRPENSQYSTPRRRGVLGVTSPPLSLPHMSGAGLSSARSKASARTPSRFRRGHRGINSSPLSSPPPVLFDPYQESSSSTSHQGSSEAGSAASSESGETPPSSMPSLTSQTSNPSRSSLPNLKGRDLFDVSIWSDPIRTSVFYTFASTLRQKSRDVEPTASHHFISHLRDRGKLVRCYTQNIDQIEEKVGLSTSLQQGPGSRGRFSRKSAGGFSNTSEPTDGKDNVRRVDVNNGGVECVFLHGSLQSLRCFLCGQVCEWDEEGRHLETLSGRQPECPHCAGATAARQERGKRALGVGKLRPDIVLYGEEHPNAHLIDPLVKHDLGLYPDFMLILGTSLKVHGLKVIVREFAKAVHSKGGKVVFVNFTKAPESAWGDIIDYWIRWDCDAWVANLQQRIPLLWLPPGTKLPAPPKRKRESSGLEKTSKKRSSGLVKQGSSIVVHSPADTTVREDAIAVLGPSKPSSISDTGSQTATLADCTGNAASSGDVQGVVGSSAEPPSSEVPPAANQSGALSADLPTTAVPGLSRPGDASSGYSAATFELRTLTDEPTSEAPAADGTLVLATSTPKTPKAPARPMSLREDKCSGAYLAWQITRDLRRLSGNAAEVATFSSPIARVKPARTPRSAAKTTPPSSTPAGAPEQTHVPPSDDSPSIRPPRAAQPEAILEAIQAESTPDGAPLEDHISLRATQQGLDTQQATQEDVIPEEALQEDSIMSETTLENTVPVAAAEEETISKPALQTTSMSEQVTQVDSIPEEAVQENPSVQAPVPELPMPEETASAPLPPPASSSSPPASPSSALSSPPPTSPSAEATLDPVSPSAPIAKAAAAAKPHRKSLPANQQSSGPRPLRSQRKSLPMPSMSTPMSATPTASSKSKNKGKPKQAKGWVYVRDDDPEVQAIQRRQAMHWGTDETPLPALPPPANTLTDVGKKKEKPKKGKGWVYVPEDDPEAQAIEQRQAMYWGAEPTTQIPPPTPTDAKPDGSKKKEKPQKGKGWVYVRDDDPEAQAIQQRQAKYWGIEASTRQPLPPPIDEGRPGNGKKTAKARKSKGWVYVSEDDPEAQALEMRQAMHWGGAERPRRVDETAHPEQSPAHNPHPLPSNDADLDTSQPAIASSAKSKPRGKREKGKGWSYLPEDAPEAQELQMRRAKNFGIGLDSNTASAQSIYDALKSNPRHRKRKTIDGVEVALVANGRASRRSLPAPRAAALLQHNAHATAVFQPLPDPNEMLPVPVASAPIPKRTWADKENQSAMSSQVLSGSSLAPMRHLTLAPMRPRPSPLSFQAGVELPLSRPQPLEPLSPPPGPPAAIAPSMGRPEQGHMLAPTAFAISDALLYQLRAPPRIWTPEDQLREEAAVLALSSLKTGLR